MKIKHTRLLKTYLTKGDNKKDSDVTQKVLLKLCPTKEKGNGLGNVSAEVIINLKSNLSREQ
jgi:hypothetical protein